MTALSLPSPESVVAYEVRSGALDEVLSLFGGEAFSGGVGKEIEDLIEFGVAC